MTNFKAIIRVSALAAMGTALASCATKAPPPPAPVPAPAPVVVVPEPTPPPPRPYAPGFASDDVRIYTSSANGVRLTPLNSPTSAQMVWGLRSAFNVATVSCRGPEYADTIETYNSFLSVHARDLAATNKAMDADFRAMFGAAGKSQRDEFETDVYNFLAFPPIRDRFCPLAVDILRSVVTVPKGGLDAFAAVNYPRLSALYNGFYAEYEQYQRDVAAWDVEYGPGFAPVFFNERLSYPNPLNPLPAAPLYPADGTGTGYVQSVDVAPSVVAEDVPVIFTPGTGSGTPDSQPASGPDAIDTTGNADPGLPVNGLPPVPGEQNPSAMPPPIIVTEQPIEAPDDSADGEAGDTPG